MLLYQKGNYPLNQSKDLESHGFLNFYVDYSELGCF